MRHFRKQFDGQWKVISLNDKEIADIEKQTFDHLIRIAHDLEEMNIPPQAIPNFHTQYESFASDYIEAKYKAFQAKKAAAEKVPSTQ